VQDAFPSREELREWSGASAGSGDMPLLVELVQAARLSTTQRSMESQADEGAPSGDDRSSLSASFEPDEAGVLEQAGMTAMGATFRGTRSSSGIGREMGQAGTASADSLLGAVQHGALAGSEPFRTGVPSRTSELGLKIDLAKAQPSTAPTDTETDLERALASAMDSTFPAGDTTTEAGLWTDSTSAAEPPKVPGSAPAPPELPAADNSLTAESIEEEDFLDEELADLEQRKPNQPEEQPEEQPLDDEKGGEDDEYEDDDYEDDFDDQGATHDDDVEFDDEDMGDMLDEVNQGDTLEADLGGDDADDLSIGDSRSLEHSAGGPAQPMAGQPAAQPDDLEELEIDDDDLAF
jgi:hypothetical protein